MRKFNLLLIIVLLSSCSNQKKSAPNSPQDINLKYKEYTPIGSEIIISRADYLNKLKGFWLAQCIANWTGLVTENDKIGNIGEFKSGDFYTRDDWGKKDKLNLRGNRTDQYIDFVFEGKDGIWGADDDTDIEYMYQHLVYTNKVSKLSGEQIRDGWLKHIKHEEQNYLWVSNQRALDLMLDGEVPPETSNPIKNTDFDMIDAQLTTGGKIP